MPTLEHVLIGRLVYSKIVFYDKTFFLLLLFEVYYYINQQLSQVKKKILFYIFDPTLEGILTSSKRHSRISFSSLPYSLNYYRILRILELWKIEFFLILSSKLLLSLPRFFGSLYQNVSVLDTFWFNMDAFLIYTYWSLQPSHMFQISITFKDNLSLKMNPTSSQTRKQFLPIWHPELML